MSSSFDFDSAVAAAVANAVTLDDVQRAIIHFLREVCRATPGVGFHYVVGMISSEGPEHIPRNLERLTAYTHAVRGHHGPYAFSARSIWTDGLFGRIGETKGMTTQDWMPFWRGVMESGCTAALHLCPRWEQSHGARDEVETAQRLGIPIFLLDGAAAVVV